MRQASQSSLQIDWTARVAEVEARCRQTLTQPEFLEIPRILAALGMDPSRVGDLVHETARHGLPLTQWEAAVQAIEKHGIMESAYVLQRFILLTAGIANLPLIAQLPVAGEVKERLLEQFLYLCAPDREMNTLLNARHYGFQVMCRFMRLERFPAGQSDWEISGFPRSWLMRMPVRDIPRVLNCLALRAMARRPFFETHTAFRRELPIVTEEEERKMFRLLAASMRMQPAIKGYVSAAWFMDPKLPEVSPHLTWISTWLRECETFGAVWSNIGEAEKDAGFLVGDRRRRKLYETGEWKPLQGILLWARKDLLRWHDAECAKEERKGRLL